MDNTIESTNTDTGLLSKRQDELTVGDNLKIAAIVTAAMLAVPVVVGGVSAVVSTILDARRARKLAKADEKDQAIDTTSTEEV